MELRIDKDVLSKLPDLKFTQKDDAIIVKLDEESGSDFSIPQELLMTNLDNISWCKIDEIAKSGKAREYFTLGATKKDYMKNGFVATYQIIGFDHDDLADGSGKASISWDMVDLYKEELPMNKSDARVIWQDSYVRSFLGSAFAENVSNELLAVVKPVYKKNVDINEYIHYTSDVFWLKSEQELFGRRIFSYGNEGHWYEFYFQENFRYYKKNTNGRYDWQWLRSPDAIYSNAFCIVCTDGGVDSNLANISGGFAPCFCI